MRALIDHHLHVHSWLHDWRPVPKLIGYAWIVIAVAGLRSPGPAAAAVALGLVALLLGRIPILLALRRMSALLLFLAVFVGLMAWGGGWRHGARIAMQCCAILLLSTALLATTPTLQIFSALRTLRVPARLVELLRLSYRLTFALGDELQALRTAAACRGFALTAHPRQLHTVGRLAGALLIRGRQRSDRLYDAMLVRGYDGQARALPPPPMTWRDGLKLLAILLVGAGLVLSRWWL